MSRGKRRSVKTYLWWSVLLVSVVLALALPALSHELGIARVSLHANQRGSYVLRVSRSPVELDPRAALGLPRSCGLDRQPVRGQDRGGAFIRYDFSCASTSDGSNSISIPFAPGGAFVRREENGKLTAGFVEADPLRVGWLTLDLDDPDRGRSARTLAAYLRLGVEHILSGWDHLAFVATLCLLASGWRLFGLVSAFTLGHSITLALAVLGVIHVPSVPVEATIAWSIVVLARMAVVAERGDATHGAPLVVSFGLLHGLGFAGALASAGLPDSQLLGALFTFNLGVELGQVIFVLGLLAVARVVSAAIARVDLVHLPLPRFRVAYGIGFLGAFWFLERMAEVLHVS